MFLEKNSFAELVAMSPLISIDICILKDKKILLGKRKNSPAKNYYFVPGGRIRKNEKIETAISRLLINEIGFRLKQKINFKKNLIGIFEHFYKDNFLNNFEFDTHYVVIAFLINYKNIEKICDVERINDQHSKYIWHDLDNKQNFKIHKYTEDYINIIEK